MQGLYQNDLNICTMVHTVLFFFLFFFLLKEEMFLPLEIILSGFEINSSK